VTICGISELGLHSAAGVTHVLSILDPDWPEPEAFLSFDPHRRLELRFHDAIVPEPGITLPAAEDVARLLAFGHEAMAAQPHAHLLIHCHAGISRSTAAAALLLTQADPTRPADETLAHIARLRPRVWPNLRLIELGDAALARRGEIVAAVAALYRRVIEVEPGFGALMIQHGRGREVALAESSGQR